MVDGGWAVANHMIRTPVAVPPANDSAVVAGRRRRPRTRAIHIGNGGTWVARARRLFIRVVSDSISSRPADASKRTGAGDGVAVCSCNVKFGRCLGAIVRLVL